MFALFVVSWTLVAGSCWGPAWRSWRSWRPPPTITGATIFHPRTQIVFLFRAWCSHEFLISHEFYVLPHCFFPFSKIVAKMSFFTDDRTLQKVSQEKCNQHSFPFYITYNVSLNNLLFCKDNITELWWAIQSFNLKSLISASKNIINIILLQTRQTFYLHIRKLNLVQRHKMIVFLNHTIVFIFHFQT